MGSSSPKRGTKQPLLFIFFPLGAGGRGLLSSPSSLKLSFFNLTYSLLRLPQVKSKAELEIPDLSRRPLRKVPLAAHGQVLYHSLKQELTTVTASPLRAGASSVPLGK